jgi:hypothetical protein
MVSIFFRFRPAKMPEIYNLMTQSLEACAGGSADPILRGKQPVRKRIRQ